MDVDADNLKSSVESYNVACAQQGGDELGRTKSLTPVESRPYYAVEMTLSFINAQGGSNRNGKYQVLNYDDEIIPRLYVVGEFGPLWSRLYHGGLNVPEAICAYAAGADAAGLASWE